MNRELLNFDYFKQYFIDHAEGGYYPVYSSLESPFKDGKKPHTIDLDMICEWRLPDGKVRFLSLEFETEEQFAEIVTYLRVSAEFLHQTIMKRIGEVAKEFEEKT